MNPLKLATFAGAASLVMMLVDLFYQPMFTVHLTASFALPLWGLGFVYAGLQLIVWPATRKGIELSDKEVAKWGAKLEAATPDILEQIRAQRSVKAIAVDLQSQAGIPRDVTLRYIIALGTAMRAEQQANAAEADDGYDDDPTDAGGR